MHCHDCEFGEKVIKSDSGKWLCSNCAIRYLQEQLTQLLLEMQPQEDKKWLEVYNEI